MNVGQKADHVRAEIATGDTRGHHCHWPGCETRCAPAAWGCKKHWFMLPENIRRQIWRAYQAGQEVSKTPSREYVEVAREAQAWIARNHPAQDKLL